MTVLRQVATERGGLSVEAKRVNRRYDRRLHRQMRLSLRPEWSLWRWVARVLGQRLPSARRAALTSCRPHRRTTSFTQPVVGHARPTVPRPGGMGGGGEVAGDEGSLMPDGCRDDGGVYDV